MIRVPFMPSLLASLTLAALVPARAAKPVFRWEKMTVTQVPPSQVFTRLGLTHNVRRGYTRDGFKKTDPDPTFPPGLTDVVPMDRDHVMLVRGTDAGLAQFRERVAETAERIVNERWHVRLELLTPPDGASLGLPVEQNLPSEHPISVALGETTGLHIYALTVHVNADGSLTLTCRSGLPLPGTGGAAGVLAPTLVWTDPVSRTVAPGGVAVFDDPASARQALRRRVGLPDEPASRDYQVRVTVAAPPPPARPVEASVPAPTRESSGPRP